MTTFGMSTTVTADQCELLVRGEVDVAVADELAALGVQCAAHECVQRVIIDLSSVTFLDSTGLAALIQIQNDVDARAKKLTIRGATRSALKVLEITGLDKVFDLA